MSILVNIETPDGCYNCPFFRIVSTQKTITAIPLIQYTKAFCLALKAEFLNETNIAVRPSGCPLIEVPPHGRLIDADAFVKEKQEWYCKQNCERRKGIKNGKKCFVYKIGEAPCRACEIDDLISAVDDAPTIIEAEDGI